jgi:RNA polymerase sigma-70 factor (ECF subfamily)
MSGLDLAALYRTHGHVVVRRARQILGNEADAREICQELFVSLVEDGSVLANVRSPAAWLYTAGTTRALQRLRNQSNRQRLLDQRDPIGASAPVRPDRFAAARELLARMPEQLALAVTMYHLDEMTHDEIAAVLGMSRRNVGLVLERAQRWIASQEESNVATS